MTKPNPENKFAMNYLMKTTSQVILEWSEEWMEPYKALEKRVDNTQQKVLHLL